MKFLTNRGLKQLMDGTIDLQADTVKVVLFSGQKTGGATTSSSAVITMTSTTGLVAGMRCTHANVPANTKILTVDSGTNVTLAAPASASGSGLTFTFEADPDLDFMGQMAGLETGGTGYSAGYGGSGRHALASKTFTEDDTNNRSIFDAADASWTGFSPTAPVTAFGLVKETTDDASTTLLYYCSDGGFPLSTTGGRCDLVWDATAGILTFN